MNRSAFFYGIIAFAISCMVVFYIQNKNQDDGETETNATNVSTVETSLADGSANVPVVMTTDGEILNNASKADWSEYKDPPSADFLAANALQKQENTSDGKTWYIKAPAGFAGGYYNEKNDGEKSMFFVANPNSLADAKYRAANLAKEIQQDFPGSNISVQIEDPKAYVATIEDAGMGDGKYTLYMHSKDDQHVVAVEIGYGE